MVLHLRSLSKGEGILDVNAEIADRALDLRVSEQNLHGAEISRLLIDDGRLGSTQRMGPVVLPAQPDPGNPFVNKASILPRADVIGMIDPAGKTKSSSVPPRRSSQARMLPRAGSRSSN